IIASSESTVGYYRFDLNTLVAEKVSSSPDVFNASDLANGNLAFDTKKKKKKEREQEEEQPVVVAPEQPKEETTTEAARTVQPQETLKTGSISVYPNPVRNGYFRLAFNDQPAGRYQVQVVDMQGKLIKAQEVNIANKVQVQEFNIPELTAGGSYLVKVTSTENNVSITNKIVVQ
ncbi:MAG TPA: T9SS type A sorting domain-containing protein, partial [Chitinophagaceae bacterium]|nr:T9SS type A sorting domain-containing protein [Chitinophagaceae bacterium]